MILSVSRRTDIPAFYAPWFAERVHEGFVMVRNPMNHYQVSKVCLDPDVIDWIVFWTKDAEPMFPYLDDIEKMYERRFYFQYTLNGYEADVEPNLPPLNNRIAAFVRLSERIGPERVIWRYDPVLLTDRYTLSWHADRFGEVAQSLKAHTNTCVFSFVDIYEKVKNNIRGLNLRSCDASERNDLASAFSIVVRENGMKLRTCAEEVDLSRYGIAPGSCIDGDLITALLGYKLTAKKDKNQRDGCRCLESVDIGQYNTCRHGCKYCYANFNPQSVDTFSRQHDPHSPFLVGHSRAEDQVTDRKMARMRDIRPEQISMQLSDTVFYNGRDHASP